MYTRIKDLREDKDLTQKQVADFLGLSRSGYSKYEQGENDVPTWVLIQLADFYHTSISYILNLTDQIVFEHDNNVAKTKHYPRIKHLRKTAGLNQTQLSCKLNMSQTGYSNYETGTCDIPTDILITLADFYNVSIDYILGRTDNPKRI